MLVLKQIIIRTLGMCVSRFFRIFLIVNLCLLSTAIKAQISHISLHDVESAFDKPFSVRLNIVEQAETQLQLQFILIQNNQQISLKPARLSRYMLRVTSTETLAEHAAIYVYQLINNQWQKIEVIPVSGDPIFDHQVVLPTASQKRTPIIAKTSTTEPVNSKSLDSISTNSPTESCMLKRVGNETLWSLATRYSLQWQIDVFSAMIAIYRVNINQFGNQHIGLLRNDVTLVCPSEAILEKVGDKAKMKSEFQRLNALPKK